jgi:hypothetical protein
MKPMSMKAMSTGQMMGLMCASMSMFLGMPNAFAFSQSVQVSNYNHIWPTSTTNWGSGDNSYYSHFWHVGAVSHNGTGVAYYNQYLALPYIGGTATHGVYVNPETDGEWCATADANFQYASGPFGDYVSDEACMVSG